MEISPGGSTASLAVVWQGRGRLVCLKADYLLPLVVCEDRNIQPIWSSCISPKLGKLPAVHDPTFSTVGDITQSIPVQTQSAFGGFSMSGQAMALDLATGSSLLLEDCEPVVIHTIGDA